VSASGPRLSRCLNVDGDIDDGGLDEAEKREDIRAVVETLQRLSPVQVEVVRAIIHRFADEQFGEMLRTDFLTKEAYEYFSMRLAAHHAYSASVLKKENFEHILEEAFSRTGVSAKRANSMTVRGADLTVDGVTLSLKTEAARNLPTVYHNIQADGGSLDQANHLRRRRTCVHRPDGDAPFQ
jgi:hypothetical protein